MRSRASSDQAGAGLVSSTRTSLLHRFDWIGFCSNRHGKTRALLRGTLAPFAVLAGMTVTTPTFAITCVDYDGFVKALGEKTVARITDKNFCPADRAPSGPDRALRRAIGSAMSAAKMSGCKWQLREDGSGVGFGPVPGHYLRFRNYDGSVWFHVRTWDVRTPTEEIVDRQRKALEILSEILSDRLMRCMNPQGKYSDMRIFPATVTPDDPPLPFGYGDGQQPEEAPGRVARYTPADIAALAENLGTLIDEARQRSLSEFQAPALDDSDEPEDAKIRSEDPSKPRDHAGTGAETGDPTGTGAETGDPTGTGAENGGQEGGEESTGTGTSSSSSGLIPGGAAWLGDLMRMVLAYFGLDQYAQFGLMALAMLAPELLEQIGELAEAVTAGLKSDSLDEFMSQAREIFMLAMAVNTTMNSIETQFGGVDNFREALASTSKVLQDMPPELRKELEKTMGVEGKIDELAKKATGLSELPISFDFTDPNMAQELGKLVREIAEKKAREEVQKFLVEELDLDGLGIPVESFMQAASGVFEGDVDGAAVKVGRVVLQGVGSKAGLSPQDIDDLGTGDVGVVMKRRGKEIAQKEIRALARKNGLDVDPVAIWEADAPVEEAGRALTRTVIQRMPPEYRDHARALADATVEGDGAKQRQAAKDAARGIAILELARHMNPDRAQDLTGIAEAILTDEDPVAVSETIMITELARTLENPNALDGVTNFQDLLKKASDEPEILVAAAVGQETELVTLAVQLVAGDLEAAEALRKQGMRRAFDMVEELGADLEYKAVEALRAELRRHPNFLKNSGTARCLAGASEAPADCVRNIGVREKRALYEKLASLDPSGSAAALTDALVNGNTDAAVAVIRERAVEEAGGLRRSLEEDALKMVREALADLPPDIRDTRFVRRMADARSVAEIVRVFRDGAAMAALRADIAAVDPVLAEALDALGKGDVRQVEALLQARARRELQKLRSHAEARALAALRESLDDAPPVVQVVTADLRTATTLGEAMAVLSSVPPDDAARQWLASENPLLAQVFDAAWAGDGEALRELAVASGRDALDREAMRHLRRLLNRLPDTSLTRQLREAKTLEAVRAVIDDAKQDILDRAIAEIAEDDRPLADAVREVFAAMRAKDEQRMTAAIDTLRQQGGLVVESRVRDRLLSEIKALTKDVVPLAEAGLADADTLEEAVAIVRRTLTCNGMLSLLGQTKISPEVVAVMRAACDGKDIDLRHVADAAIQEGRIALETEAKTRTLDVLHDAARAAGLGPDHAVIQARTMETALVAWRETIETADKQIIKRIGMKNPDVAALLSDLTAADADPAEVTQKFVLDQAEAKLAKRLAANLRRLADDIRPDDLRDLVLSELTDIENLSGLETALRNIRKGAPAALSALHPDLAGVFDDRGTLDPERMRAVVEELALRAAVRAERRLQGAAMERVREAINKLDANARHPALERLADFDNLRDAAAYAVRHDRTTWLAIAARASHADPELQTVLVAFAEGSLDHITDVATILAKQAADDAVTRIKARTLDGVRRWLLSRSWLEKEEIQQLVNAQSLDELKDFGRDERARLCVETTDEVAMLFCDLIEDGGRFDTSSLQSVFSSLPETPRTALAGVGRQIAEKGLKKAVQNGFSSAEVVPDAASFAAALIAAEKIDIKAQSMARLLRSDTVAALDPATRAAFVAMLKGQEPVDAALRVLFEGTILSDELRAVDVQAVLRDLAGEVTRDTVAGAMVHVAKTVAEAEIKAENLLATVSSLLEREAGLRTVGPRMRLLLASWMTGGDVQTLLQESLFDALDLDVAARKALLAGNPGPALAAHLGMSAPPSFAELLIQRYSKRLTSSQQRILRDPKSEGREVLREALAVILGQEAKIDEQVDDFLRTPEKTAARLLADLVCGDNRNACSPQRQAIAQRMAFEEEAQFAARLMDEIADQVREDCTKNFAEADLPQRLPPSGVISACTKFATALPKATTGELDERRAYLAEELEARGKHLVTVSSMEAVDERLARIHFYARYARYREACVSMDGRDKITSDAKVTAAVACAPCDALFDGVQPPAEPGKALETHAILSLENDPLVQCLEKF